MSGPSLWMPDGPTVAQHALDRAHRKVDVVAGGAVYEHETNAELACRDCRGPGDRRARPEVAGPGEVMISHGRDPAQQRLGDADERGGHRQLFVDPGLRVVATHRSQPVAHRDVARIGRGAERGLQQVMMRVHQSGHDHAACGIKAHHRLALLERRGSYSRHPPAGAVDVGIGVLVHAGPYDRRAGHGEHAAIVLTLSRALVTAM
jgi:hypothetical protein